MKKYIGTKTVSATPAWRIGGKVYPKDGAVPRSMDKEDGYKVVYEDGYESWSPKEVFEKAYKIAETPVDRMQIEASELESKYVKLAAFVDSGKMDEVVDDEYNKCLLETQCGTMFDYIRLLDTRIQRIWSSQWRRDKYVVWMTYMKTLLGIKFMENTEASAIFDTKQEASKHAKRMRHKYSVPKKYN